MHIPDGYLSPQTYVPLYGASVVFWGLALNKVKKELSTKEVPYLAMAAAFSFLIQMFNVPIPGGSILMAPVDRIAQWARRNSLWSLTFGLSCCAIEMMASAASHYDLIGRASCRERV